MLEALAYQAARAGWTQAAVVGLPEGCDDAEGLEELHVSVFPVVFGRDGLGFAVPGMSDVMPYESSRFSSLTPGMLRAYRNAWRDHLAAVIGSFRPHVIHAHHVWITSSLIKEIAPGTPSVVHCHATGLRQMELCPDLAPEVRAGCARSDRFAVLRRGHAARLEEILANEGLRREIIIEELEQVEELFQDPRRTEIIDAQGEIGIEDIIAEEDMLVTISYRGYIKRVSPRLYRSQNRGGKGRIGMNIKDEDFVTQIFTASTHDYLLFFTDQGRVYSVKVHELPYVGPASRGRSIVNLINLRKGEKIATAFSLRDFESYPHVLFITHNGVVKKTPLAAYRHIHSGGILALKIRPNDSLVKVLGVRDDQDVIICSHGGKAIRFSVNEIRPMGRTAAGVRAIRLSDDDYVIGMDIVQEGATLLTVTERGYGKRSPFSEYRNQARGGSGVINLKITKKVGYPAGVLKVEEGDGVVLITSSGKLIRLSVADVPVIGRNTQGVRLINIEEGESVAAITKLVER